VVGVEVVVVVVVGVEVDVVVGVGVEVVVEVGVEVVVVLIPEEDFIGTGAIIYRAIILS